MENIIKKLTEISKDIVSVANSIDQHTHVKEASEVVTLDSDKVLDFLTFFCKES